MKRLIVVLSAVFLFAAATLLAAPAKPKSVIHVITVKWKDGVTDAQIAAALKAAETMDYAGLKNVWTRPIKMQLPEGYRNIIVMEFESEAALKAYTDSPAQKKFYEVYLPLRGQSSTHDITN